MRESDFATESPHSGMLLDRSGPRRMVIWIATLMLAWVVISFVWTTPEKSAVPAPSTLLRLDINQATSREFCLLPNVGPVLARRITQDREKNGRFQNIDDLKRVRGVGDKTLAELRRYCLPVKTPDTHVAGTGQPQH